MRDQQFIINNRYEVNPTLNLVKDLAFKKEARIEQRLIILLSLLAEHKDKLVRREVLMKEIWNDYGGADESLTQSVSALRKILNDDKKEIIETIPKKGYILHATVSPIKDNSKPDVSRKEMKRKPVFLITGIMVVLLTGLIFYLRSLSKNNSGQRQLKNLNDTSISFREVNKSSEENYLNTITTVGPDSVQYKLVSIGDRKPLFYINQRLVSEDEMEKYLPLISEMKKQLMKKREQADREKN